MCHICFNRGISGFNRVRFVVQPCQICGLTVHVPHDMRAIKYHEESCAEQLRAWLKRHHQRSAARISSHFWPSATIPATTINWRCKDGDPLCASADVLAPILPHP